MEIHHPAAIIHITISKTKLRTTVFALGRKRRTAKAIERCVQTIFTGGYVDRPAIESLGLNVGASANLVIEIILNLYYTLGCLFLFMFKDEKWATGSFFYSLLLLAEKKEGQEFFPLFMMRSEEFNDLSGEQREMGEHFLISAQRVKKEDQSADVDKIAEVLREASEKYLVDVRKVFGS